MDWHDPQNVVKRPVQPSPSEEPEQAVHDCIRAFVEGDYDGCVRQVMALAPDKRPYELWQMLLISLGRSGAPERAEQIGRRGTAEQWIKEGKNAVKWTKLSCRRFKDNAARLQLFALAYNLANALRQLSLPRSIRCWTLTTLLEKLLKIGAADFGG
jgi:hypothetical protein